VQVVLMHVVVVRPVVDVVEKHPVLKSAEKGDHTCQQDEAMSDATGRDAPLHTPSWSEAPKRTFHLSE